MVEIYAFLMLLFVYFILLLHLLLRLRKDFLRHDPTSRLCLLFKLYRALIDFQLCSNFSYVLVLFLADETYFVLSFRQSFTILSTIKNLFTLKFLRFVNCEAFQGHHGLKAILKPIRFAREYCF